MAEMGFVTESVPRISEERVGMAKLFSAEQPPGDQNGVLEVCSTEIGRTSSCTRSVIVAATAQVS